MAQPPPLMYYECDGCSEKMLELKARIHCQVCADHDLCTNCYVLGISTEGHLKSHSSIIIAKSGYPLPPSPPTLPPRPKVPSPQPPPGRAIPALVHRPAPISSQPVKQSNPSSVQAVAQGGWKPLFSGSSATPTFVALLTAVFEQLDTDKDGLITPEQYISFLEVQHYTNEEHVCRYFRSLSRFNFQTSISKSEFEIRF